MRGWRQWIRHDVFDKCGIRKEVPPEEYRDILITRPPGQWERWNCDAKTQKLNNAGSSECVVDGNESGTTALTNSASKISCATAKYVTEKIEQVYCISAVHVNVMESQEWTALCIRDVLQCIRNNAFDYGGFKHRMHHMQQSRDVILVTPACWHVCKNTTLPTQYLINAGSCDCALCCNGSKTT